MVDYYKEACRALENSETASLLGKIQKDWKKLVQMKIYYFAAVAHVSGERDVVGGTPAKGLWPLPGVFWPVSKILGALMSPARVFLQLHMGKQAEEQQKFGERVSGAASARFTPSGLSTAARVLGVSSCWVFTALGARALGEPC